MRQECGKTIRSGVWKKWVRDILVIEPMGLGQVEHLHGWRTPTNDTTGEHQPEQQPNRSDSAETAESLNDIEASSRFSRFVFPPLSCPIR